MAEAVGEERGEREGRDALDRRGEVGHAGGSADARRDLVHAVVGEPFPGRVPFERVLPAVAAPGRQDEALGAGLGDGVHAVTVLPHDVPELHGAEVGEDHLGEPFLPVHADAQRAAHDAVRSVGGDDVAGIDPLDGTGGDVAQRHRGPARPGGDVEHLGAGVEAGVRQRRQVPAEHRLEVVLGHARRGGRAQHRALLPARKADRHRHADVRAGERRADQHRPFHVRAAGPHLLLEAPGPEELHGPQADRGGPGQGGRLGPALDQAARDPAARQRDGGGQTGRAGPDHEHRGRSADCRGPVQRRRGVEVGAHGRSSSVDML